MRYLRYEDFTVQNSELGRESVIGSFEVPRGMCYHLLREPMKIYLVRQPTSDEKKNTGTCKLNGALNATANKFALDNGAGGAPAGLGSGDDGKWFVVKIENEYILAEYDHQASPGAGSENFINAVRGYSSTTAAAHSDNTDATVYNSAYVEHGIVKIRVWNQNKSRFTYIFEHNPAIIMGAGFDQDDARMVLRLDQELYVPEKFTIELIYESGNDVFDADATYPKNNLKTNFVMIPYEPYDRITVQEKTGYNLRALVPVVEEQLHG